MRNATLNNAPFQCILCAPSDHIDVVRRTSRHPQVNGEKRKALSGFAKCPTSLVAGARYAQRCPVEFGVPMEVVIAA
jgi:hypothetical protein